ncbi:MAG: hypothetical protein ORN27_08180, partial [Rhodoluna sp.]|nr:hypothetical protein [Rhodoluna sp.]
LEPEASESEPYLVDENLPAVSLPIRRPVAKAPPSPEKKTQSLSEPTSNPEQNVQSELTANPEPARMPPPEPSIDFAPWVNALSGLSLLIGLIQAVRRLKQNRRASARRFVRIS